MKLLIFVVLFLSVFSKIFCISNQLDLSQSNDKSKDSEIRIFYIGNSNNVYKEIFLTFNTGKCGIVPIDWKSFGLYLCDITSDSVYLLAKSISKTNSSVNCKILKSDDNDFFVLVLNASGKKINRIIFDRGELLTLLKSIENNFDYKNFEIEQKDIIKKFYEQLKSK